MPIDFFKRFPDALTPYPALDANTAEQYQQRAYIETLELLPDWTAPGHGPDQAPTSPKRPIIQVVNAGAGSGKTRYIVATINTLQQTNLPGLPAHRIHASSFTNAASDQLRGRQLQSQIEILQHKTQSTSEVHNSLRRQGVSTTSTLHGLAYQVVSQLSPYLSAPAFISREYWHLLERRNPHWFGMQPDTQEVFDPRTKRTSAHSCPEQMPSPGEDDSHGLRLAFHAFLLHFKRATIEPEFFKAITPFIPKSSPLHKWLCNPYFSQEITRRLSECDPSLMGFEGVVNSHNAGASDVLGVATVALLALLKERMTRPLAQCTAIDSCSQGLPLVLFVDEAQDLDPLQGLFLFALFLTGTSLVIVGDPRQTLYGFRDALCNAPFQADFWQALAISSGQAAGVNVSPHALLTNYRGREAIVNASESFSRHLVAASHQLHQQTLSLEKNAIHPIIDPASVLASHAFLGGTAEEVADKKRASLIFIQGSGWARPLLELESQAATHRDRNKTNPSEQATRSASSQPHKAASDGATSGGKLAMSQPVESATIASPFRVAMGWEDLDAPQLPGAPAPVAQSIPPQPPSPEDQAEEMDVSEIARSSSIPSAPATSQSSRKPRKTPRKQTPFEGAYGGTGEAALLKLLAQFRTRLEFGESVALLTRRNIEPSDYRCLELLLELASPPGAKRIRLRLLNSSASALFGRMSFLTEDRDIANTTPFSNFLIAAAVSFVVDVNYAVVTRQHKEPRPQNRVSCGFNYFPLDSRKGKPWDADSLRWIGEDLSPFFEACYSQLADVFPGCDIERVRQQWPALCSLAVDFVGRVLLRHGAVAKKTISSSQPIPCKIDSMLSQSVSRDLAQTVRLPEAASPYPRAIRSPEKARQFLNCMEQAISRTPFFVNANSRSILRAAGLPVEAMNIHTSLLGFPAQFDALANQERERESRESWVDRRDGLQAARESAANAFFDCWRTTAGSVLRICSQALAHEAREQDNVVNEEARYKCLRAFRNARHPFSIYKKTQNEGGDTIYEGLFSKFFTPVKDAKAVRPSTTHNDSERLFIEVSTVHSAKGLEWDHVLWIPTGGSGGRKDSTARSEHFRSERDCCYVAMTRARKTLTIMARAPSSSPKVKTARAGTLAIHELFVWARAQGLLAPQAIPLDFGPPPTRIAPHEGEALAMQETSHSELERSKTCGAWHYFEDSWGPNSPKSLKHAPYNFFFHTSLAALCAVMSARSLRDATDPYWVIGTGCVLARKAGLNEEQTYEQLMQSPEGCFEAAQHLVSTLSPLYFQDDDEDLAPKTNYYARTLLHQIASFAAESELAKRLIEAADQSTWVVRIEMAQRALCPHVNTSTDRSLPPAVQWVPLVGVPDVSIVGGGLLFTADFKTIPRSSSRGTKSEGELLGDFERKVSGNTQLQMEFYQALALSDSLELQAELIYVADALLPLNAKEKQEILLAAGENGCCAPLPYPKSTGPYRVRTRSVHARILNAKWMISPGSEPSKTFQQAVGDAILLREKIPYKSKRAAGVLVCHPIFTEQQGYAEVSVSDCQTCPSGGFCHLNKYSHAQEASPLE